MKTKFLSLLLAISLIAGLFPAMMASAETIATNTPTSTPITSATTAPTAATTKTTTPTATAPTVTEPTTAPTTEPTGMTDPKVSISVNLCETSTPQDYLAVLTVSKGGAPVYATTKDSGIPTLVTDGSVPTNNYVKFEYPQNGLPTITLMNAKLRSTGNVLDLSSFDISVKIVVAGNSTIESTGKCGIYRASYGDITILGPKKLTMNCSSSAIAFSGDPYGNSLSLKGLTLKATTYADTPGRTFHIPAGNLTVDSCNIELVNRVGNGVYLGQGNVSDAKGRGNAAISGSVFSANSKNTALQLDGNLSIVDANVQFSSDTRALYCTGNLIANRSTLVMTGRSNTVETVNVGGEFTLRNSNTEIIGTRFAIFGDTTLPMPLGEYTIVAGINRDSTAPYNETLAGAYQYYYAESLELSTDPTVPTGTETVPTGTETETDPTETDPTGTDPTDPTFFPPIEPTADSSATTKITLATPSNPTPPTNNTPGRSSGLFWILAVLMVLGACGAAAMAIMMFRRSAEEEFDEERDENSEEESEAEIVEEIKEHTNEEPQEDLDEDSKKFSIKKFKKLFAKLLEDDINE